MVVRVGGRHQFKALSGKRNISQFLPDVTVREPLSTQLSTANTFETLNYPCEKDIEVILLGTQCSVKINAHGSFFMYLLFSQEIKS